MNEILDPCEEHAITKGISLGIHCGHKYAHVGLTINGFGRNSRPWDIQVQKYLSLVPLNLLSKTRYIETVFRTIILLIC